MGIDLGHLLVESGSGEGTAVRHAIQQATAMVKLLSAGILIFTASAVAGAVLVLCQPPEAKCSQLDHCPSGSCRASYDCGPYCACVHAGESSVCVKVN